MTSTPPTKKAPPLPAPAAASPSATASHRLPPRGPNGSSSGKLASLGAEVRFVSGRVHDYVWYGVVWVDDWSMNHVNWSCNSTLP
jgi:hypothetical protein